MMIDPTCWPFKERPATNAMIQIVLGIWIIIILAMWPGPVFTIGIALIFFFGGRSLYRDVRKEWFPKKPDWIVIGKDGTKRLSDTEEGKLFQIVGVKNTCPDCGGKGFFKGPSGGMSTNIFCVNPRCRSGFNITYFTDVDGTIERISKGDLERFPIDDAMKIEIRAAERKPNKCDDCPSAKTGPDATCCNGTTPKPDAGTFDRGENCIDAEEGA